MGLDPDKVAHIRIGTPFLGNSSWQRIHQLTEPVSAPEASFRMVPEFQYLQANNRSNGFAEIGE